MGWEFVDVQCSQDGSAVNIEDLYRVKISFYHPGGFDALLCLNKPRIVTATTNLPSERMVALLPVSLNLEIVLRLLRSRCEYLYPCSRGHRILVWSTWGKVD